MAKSSRRRAILSGDRGQLFGAHLALLLAAATPIGAQTIASGATAPKEPQALLAQWRTSVDGARQALDRLPGTASFAQRLHARAGLDQAVRTGVDDARLLPFEKQQAVMGVIGPASEAVDVENTRFLETGLPQSGWFSVRRDGAQVVEDAWLLVQHSPDTFFQSEALRRMGPSPAAQGIEGKAYAYLYDRVQVRSGHPQKYGTQARCNAHRIELFPIDDPARVDNLRAQIGLPESLSAYIARVKVGSPC